MRKQGPQSLALLCVLIVAALALGAGPALADPPPPGSTWTETYITEADGTKLHADVLRPEGLKDTDKTPVILSIGPYFNHSGQTGPAGPVEDTPYTPTGGRGPSARFYDFVEGAHLMQRGYTYVMVDLRGFGGSSGCLDWAGPGEQADVKAAVEWAAKQSWSTGKVGMYGKSYDAVTGLIGTAVRPQGLAAVVSQEPVYDLYRYLYSNRVRYENSLATPALYDMIAETPGTTNDTPDYNTNGANDLQRPGCPALNYADQQDRDHDSAYWRQRDLIAKAKGSTVPLFMTQGFLEDNTKPDGAFEFFNNMAGPKRAWFGMWDHVRGNDTDASGRLKMGRAGWFDETMRFYDQYLKGEAPAVQDPPVAVESGDGSWRAEDAWPPKDASTVSARLRPGKYTDDATNNGTAEGGSPNGEGIWTITPPLKDDAHLAGVPKLTAEVSALTQDANLAADVYDIDGDGNATLISRGTTLLPNSGTVGFELYGDDWKLPAGHRIGVLLASSNSEWWMHTPTGQQVTVKSASVELPFLSCTRNATIQGDPSLKLEAYKKDAPFQLDAQTIAEGEENAFPLPPAQHDCP
jgi:predicted acyl esterase